MNINYLLTSLLFIFASQISCNAKAEYGTGSYDTSYNPFLNHYSSVLDDSGFTLPKRASIFNQPSVFDTDPFFTQSLFPKSSFPSHDLSSSPFADFDNKFGTTSFDTSKPLFDTSESNGDDYHKRTKKTRSRKYNSESSSHSSTLYVGTIFPSTFSSNYGSSSPPFSLTSQPDTTLSNINNGHSDVDSSDSEGHDGKHKKPSPVLGNAAAFATGAVAGAAAASALGNKPLQNENTSPSSAATPANQDSQRHTSNDAKCNWCIRRNCNPGGCQDAPNFDPKKDAEALHKAVKGIGTDERVLIDILTHRSDRQIKKIRQEYQEFAKGLDSDLADDTSFKTKALLMALLQPRAVYFAEELHKAFKKDDNSAMIMILTSLSPCAIKKVGAAYILKYGKALADDIRGASAQNFEDFLVELSRGNRKPDGPVNVDQAKKDAMALYNAGPKKWFKSDKEVFIDIFTHRSYSQLRQIIKEYDAMRKPQKSNLWKDIDDNTSDKLEKGLMAMMRNVQDQPGYFADELEGSLDKLIGVGIRDNEKLIRIMRGRCGIDLGDIRDAYPKNHNGRKLADRLAKKTVMDYEEALLAMLEQPKAQKQSEA